MNQETFESLVLYATDHLWQSDRDHNYEYQPAYFRFTACAGVLTILGEPLGYSSDIYAWSSTLRDIEERWHEETSINNWEVEAFERYAEHQLMLNDPTKGPFYISKILDSTRDPHRRYVDVFDEMGFMDIEETVYPFYTVTNHTVPTLACAKWWLKDEGRDGYRYLVHRDKLDKEYWWDNRVQHDPQEVIATFTILNGIPHRVKTEVGQLR